MISRVLPRREDWPPLVLTAFLLSVSFPPLHLLVPSFVALVPFAVFVARLPQDGEGAQRALRGAYWTGVLYFAVLLYWIVIALIWFSKMAILAYLGTLVGLSAAVAFGGWAMHRMLGFGVPIWLALPLTWTSAEWLRGHYPAELAFPWLGLGSSLTGYPSVMGIAELVGSRGVTFWLAMVNGFLAAVVLSRSQGKPWRRQATVGLVVLLLPISWGMWRAATLELRPIAQVAVVQPNIPEHIKIDRDAVFDSTYEALDRLMAEIEPGSVDLVVWPEVTLPDFVADLSPSREPLRQRIQEYQSLVDAPVAFGAYGYDFTPSGDLITYNSAFLMREDGLDDFQYDKQYLVPFVERVPFLNPEWFRSLPYFGGLGRGRGSPLAQIGEGRFGVLICYESAYMEGARQMRLAGADYLLNITNDAWYGREPWYSRTTALWQHPAHAVMRAVENRIGVARAANTGISLFVDPLGRVSQRTRLFEEAVSTGTVYTTDVLTFYARYGDLTGRGAMATTLLLVLWIAWLRRRDRASSG